MGVKSCYAEGMQLLSTGEYKEAIEYFVKGLRRGGDCDCALMLGKCFEQGIGVEKDMALAKDSYKCALRKFSYMHKPDCEEIVWLQGKISEMKEVEDIREMSRFVDSVGWVKVKRAAINEWSFKYSEEGTVVHISDDCLICWGFYIAKYHAAQKNKWWTCDGHSRFYDGYTLNAELFRLQVKRG